jgi:hypothetical protein
MRLALGFLLIAIASTALARAAAQPVPSVGSEITITNAGAGSYCFDSLQDLTASENDASWSFDKLDAFLGAHSLDFFGGERAKVLSVRSTYSWKGDAIKPLRLLILSGHSERDSRWKGHTCWWEFTQSPGMERQFTWWK